ncbi:MAG: alanine racemase [Proteobacteria bacterium]|nr:alanine racemase [Pseudomonadota bacterium]
MTGSAIAILSTENLIHNVKIMQAQAPNSRILAMVKANAYGHGLRSTAKRLEPHIWSLGVARIDEALALRQAGIKIPITLMEGVFNQDELLLASCHNFPVVLHNFTQLQWLEHSKLPNKLHAWIKLDTGMNRLGFNQKEFEQAYHQLKNNRNLVHPIHIMSHLAVAEDPAHPLTQTQIASFNKATAGIGGYKSLANSASILLMPKTHYEVVRPGISLYGISPLNGKTGLDLGLRPVLTLQTRIVAIRDVEKGEYIGYGGGFQCPADMRIGVIAIGYGDGYSRNTANNTPVIVNGRRCKIVGRISMDMSTIDLSHCPDAQIGDSVTLWGEELPIEEVVAHTGNSVYDLICGVQLRVKYHWTDI